VEALASKKDFLQQQPGQQSQQPQEQFSYEELAAFSAGMAAAADVGAQGTPFSEEDLHLQHQQQLLAAAAAAGYPGDWSGIDPALLAAVAAQQHSGGCTDERLVIFAFAALQDGVADSRLAQCTLAPPHLVSAS
jgi:hypothetical protein